MKTTIVLDAMGSDQRPFPELEGAVLAANKFDIQVILVGDEQTLKAGLAKVTVTRARSASYMLLKRWIWKTIFGRHGQKKKIPWL